MRKQSNHQSTHQTSRGSDAKHNRWTLWTKSDPDPEKRISDLPPKMALPELIRPSSTSPALQRNRAHTWASDLNRRVRPQLDRKPEILKLWRFSFPLRSLLCPRQFPHWYVFNAYSINKKRETWNYVVGVYIYNWEWERERAHAESVLRTWAFAMSLWGLKIFFILYRNYCLRCSVKTRFIFYWSMQTI